MHDSFHPALNDQGIHKTVLSITNFPEVAIAELSNVHKVCDSDKYNESRVSLNNIDLNFCDFINLFYGNTSGAFNINPSCGNTLAISLTKQTYSTTQSKNLKFNLYDQILKAFSKSEGVPESCAPLDATLKLQRETFLTSSLAKLTGKQIALSLDEVLENLINRDLIEPSNDIDSFAKVKFLVRCNYYYLPLSVKLEVVFNYITDIPGYKNTSNISFPNIQCHYSKHENLNRPVTHNTFNLNGRSLLNPSYFLNEEIEPQHLKTSVSFGQDIPLNHSFEEQDNETIGDDDSASGTVNQLQSIINGDDNDHYTTTTKENAPW